jgi:hypothetical protein
MDTKPTNILNSVEDVILKVEETKIEPDICYDKEDIVDFAVKYVKSMKKGRF